MNSTTTRKRRPLRQRLRLQHHYLHRSGFYRLVRANVLKVLLIVAALLGLFLLARPHLLAYQEVLLRIIRDDLAPAHVLALFYLSESIAGMIPPDLFMLWAKARFPQMPYLMVTVLAAISYLGGITAYFIGSRIEHIPRVHAYIFDRHAEQVRFMRKWGGVFIVIAALLPIPFAIASTVAGLVEFPLRAYLLYGLTRFIRFYAYAWVIFSVVSGA